MLASFVGIITPTLIVGGVLGLESEVPYLVSMALFVSGLGTFVQARKFGPIGSGLLCLQGTSFSFISVILSAGFMVKARGGGTDEILSTIFGICFFAAFIEVVLSQFIGKLRKLITPVVTGTIITLMGLSLIKVAVTDMAGGFGASDLGAASNMGLAALVLLTIVVLNRFNNPFLRLGSIVIGLTLGFVVAWVMGRVDLAALPQVPLISVPVPFKYGFSFDWVAFIPVAVIFLISPGSGGRPDRQFDDFPTAGQGPAVYQAHQVRPVGRWPQLGDGGHLQQPADGDLRPEQRRDPVDRRGEPLRGVLYRRPAGVAGAVPDDRRGAAIDAQAGIGRRDPDHVRHRGRGGYQDPRRSRVAPTQCVDRGDLLGMGLGVAAVPEVLRELPKALHNIFESPITVGAFCAILLNIFLPEEFIELEEDEFDPESSTLKVMQDPDVTK